MGNSPQTLEVFMFKAIAGLVVVAALVKLGIWAYPPLAREYRIRRM
jgi:hypothetical protein